MKKRISYTAVTFLGIVVLIGLLVFCYGYGTTQTWNIPYSTAENILFSRLSLDKNKLTAGKLSVQAKVDDNLGKYMSMKIYSAKLNRYEPNERLDFMCQHRYNIGAIGGEYIRFSLTKRSPKKTKITVDYCDRWRGIWPPFVFWNPGLGREKHIHHEIWDKKTADKTPQAAQ